MVKIKHPYVEEQNNNKYREHPSTLLLKLLKGKKLSCPISSQHRACHDEQKKASVKIPHAFKQGKMPKRIIDAEGIICQQYRKYPKKPKEKHHLISPELPNAIPCQEECNDADVIPASLCLYARNPYRLNEPAPELRCRKVPA